MAKPNYNFEKRQRDIAKQKKQEEKRLKKLARKTEGGEGEGDADSPSDAGADADSASDDSASTQ